MKLEIGSTVGDYQIVGMLGAGGMGKVFKVRNVISDRLEAMKVLLPDLASDTELADRFMREIKVQASLEHPNIAALHTALRIDNQLLMLMEFVEGETLEHKIKDRPLPAGEAVDYIMQVLSALDFAHKHGVIHRDIKPANMMLTPAGVVKLMDFGIAKAATDRRLTMTGTTMGSLYYMSPEQIQGAADLDARADLYSVGVSLYELVTGKRPFDGDSQFAIMSAHLEKQPVPPVTVDPSLPQPLSDAILLAVAKDPNARFQSAGAFRAALGNVAGMLKPAASAGPAAATVVAPRPMVQPQPAAVAAAAQKKGGRGLWIGIGALATAMTVIGIVQFGPWKGTSAAPQLPAASVPAATQAPAQQQPATQPQTTAPAPVSQQQTAPPQQAPVQQSPVTRQPLGQAPSSRQPANQTPAPASHQPAASQVSQPAAQVPTPVQQQPPPVQQQQQAPPPSRPAYDPAKQAEMMKLREDLAMLQTRANTARSSVQRLEQQQAASGFGLRGDIKTAAGMMGTYLDGAVSALNANDPAAARGLMDKAERQVEVVEKFLGR